MSQSSRERWNRAEVSEAYLETKWFYPLEFPIDHFAGRVVVILNETAQKKIQESRGITEVPDFAVVYKWVLNKWWRKTKNSIQRKSHNPEEENLVYSVFQVQEDGTIRVLKWEDGSFRFSSDKRWFICWDKENVFLKQADINTCPENIVLGLGYQRLVPYQDTWYEGPMVYIFDSNIAQKIQLKHQLPHPPLFAQIRNGRVSHCGEQIFPQIPRDHLRYNLFYRTLEWKIDTLEWIKRGEETFRTVKIRSNEALFAVPHGVYVLPKNLENWRKNQNWK